MYKVIISEGFRRLAFAPANKVPGRNYCASHGAELVVNATKVRLESKFNPDKVLIHEFCGEYEFDKLTQPIIKGIKRDLLALKIKQAQKAKVEVWKLENEGYNLIQRDTITLHDIDSLGKRVKNTILQLINLNHKLG